MSEIEGAISAAKRFRGPQWARQTVGPVIRAGQRAARSRRGFKFGRAIPRQQADTAHAEPSLAQNPLESYFDSHDVGPGIWKFRHYFDAYHTHLAKFIGREVHVVEIGVYGGGSLAMWRNYFGPDCHVYGVDIAEECRAYEDEGVRIFIGNQADPSFWADFRQQVPTVDVVIDDGGHQDYQQIASFEALFGHLREGGVYICEDVQGVYNRFYAYAGGLGRTLNSHSPNGIAGFQQLVHSIHYYPYLIAIAKRDTPVSDLPLERRGTEWASFDSMVTGT